MFFCDEKQTKNYFGRNKTFSNIIKYSYNSYKKQKKIKIKI